ncbi:TetR/AcrR family transcriptional regulator [Sediminibacterium goheungense]|uniref:TetR family transcriptional regulator n=1 Tax=Sediminibacterium goheungense TaxID=1086393 RepID=A0A4R6IWL2_9BACT|nr:TetR/AcrR family transcriptional regulator [Sediminibacterium goheungense]TDO27102.1 TetR family transcriptional regulator [Sediminibacterium goheungense]
MTARNTDTKEEIVRIGTALIKSHGYNAFSYADIAEKLQVRNAAIHYHFRGKEDLLSEIIDQYIESYTLLDKQLKAAGASATVVLEKFIERYSCLVDANSICIIGSIASDFNTLPESVKEKVKQLVGLVLKLVEQTLVAGKKTGEFTFSEVPKTQTLLVMTNLAAGVQLARITGKRDYDTIKKAIIRQLKKG